MKLRCLAVCAFLAACGSRVPCAESAVETTVCTQCGPTDGCDRLETICAPKCSVPADCAAPRTCINGACVPFPCG